MPKSWLSKVISTVVGVVELVFDAIERACDRGGQQPMPAEHVAAHFGIGDFQPSEEKKLLHKELVQKVKERAKMRVEGSVVYPIRQKDPTLREVGDNDVFPVGGSDPLLVVGSQSENWERKIGGISRVLKSGAPEKIKAMVEAGVVREITLPSGRVLCEPAPESWNPTY